MHRVSTIVSSQQALSSMPIVAPQRSGVQFCVACVPDDKRHSDPLITLGGNNCGPHGRRRLSTNVLAPHPRDGVCWTAFLGRVCRQYGPRVSCTDNGGFPTGSGLQPTALCSQAPRPCSSSRHAVLNARKGSIASLSKISTTSRKVLFGARYVSMITRTTRSAFAAIGGDELGRASCRERVSVAGL